MEAWIGPVGVEERQDLNIEKHPLVVPVGQVERFKHRIHFAGGGVIDRSPEGVTVQVGELPRPFLTTLAIASLIVGRGQVPHTPAPPGRQLRKSFQAGNRFLCEACASWASPIMYQIKN